VNGQAVHIFFVFTFILVGTLGATMQGSQAISASPLLVAVDDDDTTIAVTDVSTFPDGDAPSEQRIIWIGDERIKYDDTNTVANTFTGCDRGYGDADPASHAAGATVYTSSGSYVNKSMDYNIASVADASGLWVAIAIPLATLRMFGLFFQLNFSFLGTDMAYLTYIWSALGIGALVSFGLALAGSRRV
jgi:hypothetical protein